MEATLPNSFDRAVPRDIFPLLGVTSLDGVGGPSRKSQQRATRRTAVVQAADEVLWGLYALSGAGQHFVGLRPSVAQRSAVDRVLFACRDDVPGPDPLAPEAALQELLGSKASAYDAEGLCSVAPYRREAVSWPTPGVRREAAPRGVRREAGGVDFFTSLPEAARRNLADAGGLFL